VPSSTSIGSDGRARPDGPGACYSVDEYNRDVIKKQRRRGRTRRTTGRATSSTCARRPGRVFLTYRHKRGDRRRRRARLCGHAALRHRGAGRHHAHAVARGRGGDTRAGRGVRRPAGPVHRRRPPPRGERRRAHDRFKGAPGDNRPGRRARLVPSPWPSRRPDADPPLQPRGEGPRGKTPGQFMDAVRPAIHGRAGGRHAGAQGRLPDVPGRAVGTRSSSARRRPVPADPSRRSTCRCSRTASWRRCWACWTRGRTSA